MRYALRLIALLVALSSVIWWISAGARIGWWQTRVGVEQTDAIAGISVIEWHDGFVPGVETPALGLLVGGGLGVSTLLFRRKSLPDPKNT